MALPGIIPFQCTAPELYMEADGTIILAATAELNLQGGVAQTQLSVLADYTFLVTDYIVGVDSAAGPLNMTLPTAAVAAGRMYIIKDEGGVSGAPAAANIINILTQGAELIDGAAATAINVNYGYISVYSDGTNWFAY